MSGITRELLLSTFQLTVTNKGEYNSTVLHSFFNYLESSQ